MALKAPKGTRDLLPDEALFWETFRSSAARVFGCYGYVYIETPIIEQTELFVRGIGEATDVVSKEMFSALSGENLKLLLNGGHLKSSSRLSLRPEGTAGVVRAVVQHDLVPQGAPPIKLWYAGPMFRAENPQKGRQRQFNQVGIECLGADSPLIDAESIIMLMEFFDMIGIPMDSVMLLLNSMGCETCRPAYREAVRAYLEKQSDQLCDTCRERAKINPLRAFDCKNKGCQAVMKGAPQSVDYLCDDCSAHYNEVKQLLAQANIAFVEDAALVRGLDYYTRTVFEVQVNEGMGSQNAIGGGGRYDKLAEEVGGRPTPGFGFAIGFERCVLALQACGTAFKKAKTCDLFVACVNDSVRSVAFSLVQDCRRAGFIAEMDYQQRSLKSQFKLADRLDASRVAILGPDELAVGKCTLRAMDTHTEMLVPLEGVISELSQAIL